MIRAEQQDELKEELGYIRLLKEQNRFYKSKVLELELVKKESELLRKSLESVSKPILMTEGKTDVDILTNAWKRLYNCECPFIIKSCNTYSDESNVSAAGCVMLANTLKCWKYDASNMLIGLFDNDEEGIKGFDLGENFEKYKENIKKHRNGNVFALVLPATEQLKKFEDVKNLCIEFYFDLESLNKKVDGMGLELEAKTIVEKCGNITINEREPDINTELYLYKPKKNTKAYFAEKVVPMLPDAKFCNFRILFEQVLKIIHNKDEQNELLDECAVTLEDRV